MPPEKNAEIIKERIRKMIKKTLIWGIIVIFLLILTAMKIYRIIRLGWFFILSPLLGAVLAVVVSLLILWILWR